MRFIVWAAIAGIALPMPSPVFAQSGAAVPHNAPECSGHGIAVPFNVPLARLCATSIAASNRADRNRYRFAISEVRTKRADVNGDGAMDLVVLLAMCERMACHPTTQGSTVAVIFRDGDTAVASYPKTLGGDAVIVSAGVGFVSVRTMEFGPNDPSCCPSKPRIRRLLF